MRAQTNGSGRGTSGFPDAFAELFGKQGQGNLGRILASLGIPDLGEPIAQGKDAVLNAMKNHVEQTTGSPMSPEALHVFEHDIDDAGDNVTMYMVKGEPVIMSTVLRAGDSGGLSMDELKNAMRFSDRHGGKSAFDHFFGFEPKGGTDTGDGRMRARVRAAMRRKDESDKRAAPLKNFLKSFEDATSEKPTEFSPSITIDLALATSVTATEIARWSRVLGDAAPKTAAAFGRLVQEFEAGYPTKLKNLAGYLEPYGVNIKILAERAKQFAQDPRSDVAELLSRDLALADMALKNALRDAADKAAKLAAEAKDI